MSDVSAMTLEEHVEAVIRAFDFDKVRKAMKAVDWRWWHSQGEPRVPSVEQMKWTARSLLLRAAVDRAWTSTGGFTASCEAKPGEYPMLGLEFTLEAASTEDVEDA